MKHRYHRPHELLKEYVRTVLILEGSLPSDSGNLPAFTNGMATLLCRTEKDPASHERIIKLTLYAKHIPAECWATDDHTTLIAYFFKPFVATCLFNINAKELTHASCDLCDWSPHKFNALKTQLIYASSTLRKLEVLDNLIIQQRKENQAVCDIIQYATDKMMYNPSGEVLPEILNELKLNERTFQRIFKRKVGITPTQYRRICQFQLSFDQLRSKQFEKISEVAFDNGFADQSHYIRTFKEFTQTTPNDYLRNGLTERK